MGFFGYIITGVVILLVIGYGEENQWSKAKKWIGIILAFFICYYLFGDSLKSEGKDYVREHLKSPSSADFYSYTKSRAVRKMIKKEWDIKYDRDCDIIILGVEATNGFGGRVRDKYIVVFKDGEAIDMADASNINRNTIRTVLGANRIEYETITD